MLSNIKSQAIIIIATIVLLIICHINTQKPPQNITTSPKNNDVWLPTHSTEKLNNIHSILKHLAQNNNFSGACIIGQKDSILLSFYHGIANYQTRDSITDTTAFQLASISKQFTAVAILQLYQQNKLKLTDSVQQYFPNFPYHNITIHQMLVHRSGLPNYHYLLDQKPIVDTPPFTNTNIIADLIEANEPRYFTPNRRYQYNNTGYAVLAAIVEKISGLSFDEYLKQYIFTPLEMTHSFAYRGLAQVKYPSHAIGYVRRRTPADDNYLDHYLGDKGIYTSAPDLFKWDQGLYKNIIIHPDTLNLAFQPMGKNPKASSNYGYGWRTMLWGDQQIKILFHSGWWHGFKTSLIRIPHDSTTIILLRNHSKSNSIGMTRLLRILYPNSTPINTPSDTLTIDNDSIE